MKNKLLIILLFIIPSKIHACAVCYGAPDDPMTKGMDMAIIFLLSTIGSILMGIIAFVIYFVRRSKLVNS